MELTIAHVSFALSISSLAIMLRLSYRVGRHLEQFDQLRARVKLHDKILKIPTEDLTDSATNGE